MKLWDPENPDFCDTFWGSHGCDLPPGHEGPCICDDREMDDDGERVGELSDLHAPSLPPYNGYGTWWHSNHDTPTPPQTLRAWREALNKTLTEELRGATTTSEASPGHRMWMEALLKGAADRVEELEAENARLVEVNEYFRNSPNLAFYAQALRDQQKLEAIRAEVASQKAQDDMTKFGEHGRWSAANAVEQVLDRMEPELPKSYQT